MQGDQILSLCHRYIDRIGYVARTMKTVGLQQIAVIGIPMVVNPTGLLCG